MASKRKTDFLIIGGGVIGLSIARELRKGGAGSVTIIDRGPIGGEASWAAAGMLSPNAETHRDDAFFRFCTESNGLYPAFASELLEETDVDIELDRSGTLYLGFDEKDEKEIIEKFEWQREAGIDVERLSAEEVLELEPGLSPHVKGGLIYSDDWQVENRKLVEALKTSCRSNRIKLIENAEATDFVFKDRAIIGAKVADEEILAGTTIVTAGAWTSGLMGDKLKFVGHVRPIRGQMIGFQPKERLLRHVVYSNNGYLVPRADRRILVGATVEDVGFNKEVTDDAVNSLRAAAIEIAPVLAGFDIKDQWAGLRPFAADGLPIIGAVPRAENLFVATAHFRNGILLAPLTAKMMASQILHREASDYAEAFSPGRFAATVAATSNS